MTLTFGPPTSQWHYHPSTKTYDLTRTSSTSPTNEKQKKLTIETTEGIPDTKIQVAVQLSVLVVVDMQNFFLEGEDKPGHKAVEPTIRVIEKCREVGIQVVWLNWGVNR